MRAAAFFALTVDVEAVAAEHELVLMAGDELAGVVLVAGDGVAAGASREVPEHVGVVGEVAVGDAAGSHGGLGIHRGLIVVLVDVAPPGLGVADEVGLGVFFEDLGEVLEAGVVALVLEVNDDGHSVAASEVGEHFHVLGGAVDVEFLFANAAGTLFEVGLELGLGFGEVGNFVAEPDEGVGNAFGEENGGLGGVDLGGEAVGFAIVGGGAGDGAAGGQENRLGDAHEALVVNELLIEAPVEIDVLVDVDDFLRGIRGEGGRRIEA